MSVQKITEGDSSCYGRYLEMPQNFWAKRHVKDVHVYFDVYFARDGKCIFLGMPQNRTHWFSFFPFQNQSREFSSKCLKLGKRGISRFSNITMLGISRKTHVIDFKTGKYENECVRFCGIPRFSSICHHMTNLLRWLSALKFGLTRTSSE